MERGGENAESGLIPHIPGLEVIASSGVPFAFQKGQGAIKDSSQVRLGL
jgi:hypothetical protein